MARGFQEINVSNFSCQPGTQRYPSLAGPHLADDYPPHISEWRSNLVALSQRDNLYFAAFFDRIHVTIPIGLKQTVGKPSLVLDLPRSQEAIGVGGYIDHVNPHCVNNMIVGNLGTHEVLLISTDDGDVIAYYTHVIEAAITRRDYSRTSIKPFFLHNVGKSAWGLAVHEQSRLIAVSSNLREVTVFLPSYKFGDDEADDASLREQPFPELSGAFTSIMTSRHHNQRRVFRLGDEGHNIPCIDFADGTDGEAKSILAVDILGNLWILDVRNGEKQRIPGRNEIHGDATMGWGVLKLPLCAFKHTTTPQEALGMPDIKGTFSVDMLEDKIEPIFDITCCIRSIRDPFVFFSAVPIAGEGNQADQSVTISALVLEDDEDVSEIETSVPVDTSDENSSGIWARDDLDDNIDYLGTAEERDEAMTMELIRQGRLGTIVPDSSRGSTHKKDTPNPLRRSAASRRREATDCFQYMVNLPSAERERLESSRNLAIMLEQYIQLKSRRFESPTIHRASEHAPTFFLSDRSAILRTYQFNVELFSPSRRIPRTICKNIVKQGRSQALGLLGPFDRLCFVKLIAELSLVIIGSQAGQAALITITRHEDFYSANGPVTTFRLDRILPREQDGLRPNSPLMGLATSPLQRRRTADGESTQRWRLFLHFYDHTVLSYELSRGDETDILLVL